MNGNKDFVFCKSLGQYYEALGKLAEPSVSDMQNEGVFHYTSTKVLNAILSTGCFRASNLFYLNDKVEYKMGVQILKQLFSDDDVIGKYIEEIESFDGKSWGGVYSISFSNKADVLQQWITYAKESGVCIELHPQIVWDTSSLSELYMKMQVGSNGYVYFKNRCFLKLAYERDSISLDNTLPQLNKDIIREVFAEAIIRSSNESDIVIDEQMVREIWCKHKEEAKHFLQLLASYYKEERFRGEGEVRAAFLPVYKSAKSKVEINYFEQSNGVLRPYIEVYFARNSHNNGEFPIACPIKSIMVGPSGDQTSVYNSIVHRLKYGETKIWKYSVSQLEEQLSDFVLGCYEKNKNLRENEYKKLAEIIVSKWCIEAGYEYHIDIATKQKVKIRIFEGKTGKIPYNCDPTVSRYLEDNYLSPLGVWVKKSSLPYIF